MNDYREVVIARYVDVRTNAKRPVGVVWYRGRKNGEWTNNYSSHERPFKSLREAREWVESAEDI